MCEQYGAEIEKLRDALSAGDHTTAMAQVSWNGAGRKGVSEGMGRRWVHSTDCSRERERERERDGWMDGCTDCRRHFRSASVCVLVQVQAEVEEKDLQLHTRRSDMDQVGGS